MSTLPRIYLTGASCAGVTTLGRSLAARMALPHLDVDDYFWMPTDPPFTTKRPPDDRVRLIAADRGTGGWVLSGSLDGWGDALADDATLIVFVVTPTTIRLQPLDARERDRYGARVEPGGDMREIHLAFRAWASQYDDPAFPGRNRGRHEAWLGERRAAMVRVDGTREVEDLVGEIVAVSGCPQ